MTALSARLSSNSHLFCCLQIAAMIGFLSVLGPKAVNADKDHEAFEQLSLNDRWYGDFLGMAERRLVRVLVVYDKVDFFIDEGRYRGMSVDLVEAFGKFINKRNIDKALQIDVIFLPVYGDQLIPSLLEGKGDIAVGNLTINEDRSKKVDFSKPFLTGVKEIVITNSKIPHLNSIEDLSGQKVHVRKSSSYYQHVLELNKTFKKKGLKPMKIIEADQHFEDSDLLQMVNLGLIRMTIVDDHIANFWGKIYKNIKLYQNIAVNEGGNIGWAFRKNSPKLAEVINDFLETSKKGTELGNVIFNKYLHDNKWARNALLPKVAHRYESVIELFKKYAEQYEFDYLMTKALAYQESQLDHSERSPCGAIGIMQILPETAADRNVGIPNIEDLEDNVHAGHKYLRFIQNRYFNEPGINNLNRHLLTFAAYNAGPRKIQDLRKETKSRGLDPNVWFKNVEVIAAEKIGRETVQYVSNIYKYYIAYKLSTDKDDKVKEKNIILAKNTPKFSGLTRLLDVR